jgi:hypothetical protein
MFLDERGNATMRVMPVIAVLSSCLLLLLADAAQAASIGPDCTPSGLISVAKAALNKAEFWKKALAEIDEEVAGAQQEFRLSALERKNDKIRSALHDQEMLAAAATPENKLAIEHTITEVDREFGNVGAILAKADEERLQSVLRWADKCRPYAQWKLTAALSPQQAPPVPTRPAVVPQPAPVAQPKTTKTPGYDVEGALSAGLTHAEIADYLAAKGGYDLAGARKAGLSDNEIIDYLAPPLPAPAAAPAPTSAPTPAPLSIDPGWVQNALNVGYSPTAIADYIQTQGGTYIAAARQAGYSDDEIVKYLATPPPPVYDQATARAAGIPDGQIAEFIALTRWIFLGPMIIIGVAVGIGARLKLSRFQFIKLLLTAFITAFGVGLSTYHAAYPTYPRGVQKAAEWAQHPYASMLGSATPALVLSPVFYWWLGKAKWFRRAFSDKPPGT